MSHLVITKISDELTNEIRNRLIENFVPKMHLDASNYAKGRSIVWIQHEWDLLHKTFSNSNAIQDKQIWEICKDIFPQADLGLVTLGTAGINYHRDDRYADFLACSINLGSCTWGYKEHYPYIDRWTKDLNENVKEELIPLNGGEVIKFNCKNPHAVLNPNPNRLSINLWKVSNRESSNFNKYIANL